MLLLRSPPSLLSNCLPCHLIHIWGRENVENIVFKKNQNHLIKVPFKTLCSDIVNVVMSKSKALQKCLSLWLYLFWSTFLSLSFWSNVGTIALLIVSCSLTSNVRGYSLMTSSYLRAIMSIFGYPTFKVQAKI